MLIINVILLSVFPINCYTDILKDPVRWNKTNMIEVNQIILFIIISKVNFYKYI